MCIRAGQVVAWLCACVCELYIAMYVCGVSTEVCSHVATVKKKRIKTFVRSCVGRKTLSTVLFLSSPFKLEVR